MDERIRFVLRLKDGESMAGLCREFQISRKTGYKIFELRIGGAYANQLPAHIGSAIVAVKREKWVLILAIIGSVMRTLPPEGDDIN